MRDDFRLPALENAPRRMPGWAIQGLSGVLVARSDPARRLPFVKLGKKCILMPPFFSCSFGKEKKFEGYTLDDLRDPERPRSSVPDPRE